MQNALSAISGPPEAPSPQMPQQDQGQPSGAQPGGGQPGQALPPPPSHQQTVAALKHFGAIERELTALLKDPDVGKADLKSKIIDGTTALVAQGVLTPAAAVIQLGTVPEKPFEQRAWLEQHLIQTVTAANNILAYHGQAFAGQEADNVNGHGDDNHLDTVAGLMSQIKGGK